MSESMINRITILLLTVIPSVLILLQIFLAFRKRLRWSMISPILWTGIGTWMLLREKESYGTFSFELLLFILLGDLFLFGITAFIRKRRERKNH